MKRKKLLVGTVLLLVPLIVAGCAAGVSQEEYDAVVAERDSLETQLTDLLALYGAPTPTPTPLEAFPTTEVEIIRDVEYGRVDGVSLLLDIHRPKEPILGSPMPGVVVLHPGAWRTGDKAEVGLTSLANHGFFVVSVNYRLSDVAKFPAAVEDSKCAVRWLRANAQKYNVDPDHIGVIGGSAGGHLAMMVGCADEEAGLDGTGSWEGVSSRVQAVVSHCGPTLLGIPPDAFYETERGKGSASVNFLGATPMERPDLFRLASPMTYVSEDDPPLLLIHGDLDEAAPFWHAEIMYYMCNTLGVEVTLIKVVGGTHTFTAPDHPPTSPSREEIIAIELAFLIEHLVTR